MKVEVLTEQKSLEDTLNYLGKQAGVCYLSEPYANMEHKVQKNIKRCKQALALGHHSIAEHLHVTLLLEDIPKYLAMWLNTQGVYSTSEKSGRYTDISQGLSLTEAALYKKWVEILKPEIKRKYTQLNEAEVARHAMENGRYMLSMYIPTTMVYTTNMRQWGYICRRLERLLQQPTVLPEEAEAAELLLKKLKEVQILDCLQLQELYPRPLMRQELKRVTEIPCNYCAESNNYTAGYTASTVAVAQLIRHRTVKYTMGIIPNAYYTPPIVQSMGKESEWLKDIATVDSPQGQLWLVREQGNLFALREKARERLCGRAQLEVYRITKDTIEQVVSETEVKTEEQKKLAALVSGTGVAKLKCEIYPCMQGCSLQDKNRII